MRYDLAAYLLIGALAGFLWNRSELGRTSLKRLVPGYCAFLFLWPLLILGAVAVAAVWTKVWRKTHAEDHPIEPDRRAELPAFAKETAEPHPL